MSKICSYCGHINRDEATFCGNCGKRIKSEYAPNNLTDGSSSSTKNDNPKVTYATNANGNNSAVVCCVVFLVLFIILLIMSKG